MVMYRPFLHYVSGGSQARGVDKRSYACAAACVSVSRNIVHITTGMHKRGLLNGSFWFTMYTTYFAILSLIFFVVENPDSPTAKDGVLKDAMEGKNTLAGLAKKSMAADRCSQSLTVCFFPRHFTGIVGKFETKQTLQCLFKTLPEMLKNRQSSKVPVNLKRPAPSNFARESEPIQNQPVQTLPQRSSTFPAQMMTQSSPTTPVGSRRQKSLDTTQPINRASENGTHSAWLPSTPELLTETMSTPEPSSASSFSVPFSNQEPSSLAWAQQFNGPNNVPDLMPMMFPSDDPFAYPTQPMSTLEDDHFKHERSGASRPQSSFDTASQQQKVGSNTPSDPSGTGISTTSFDAFSNFSNFPIGATSGVKSSIPSRLQQPTTQPMNLSRLHSPISQAQTPSEHINSPDLVSIPNQNFVWQGYNFQPTNMDAVKNDPTMSTMQQDTAPQSGMSDINMGLDENSLNMNMDLSISFDDLFGNNTSFRPGAGTANDDWTQWMNAGV